jgi:chromate transporter
MAATTSISSMRSEPKARSSSSLEIFLAFLKLGCTSFGGPVAHLGYFRAEFVERRKWLTDSSFAELLGIAQSLPGPASSQLGFGLGLLRGGAWGGLAAWLGFTLPSALLMLSFGLGQSAFSGRLALAVLHGFQLVAVAVVAQAVTAMQKSLAPDRQRLTLAVAATAIVLYAPALLGTVLAIITGALAGIFLLRSHDGQRSEPLQIRLSRATGWVTASILSAGLGMSALLHGAQATTGTIFASFYRTGALVFGGGHVVLPLLNETTVAKGWISPDTFLTGYGAAQAVPGPLFTFAAFLGAAIRPSPHPILFGLIALISIFLPGLLLMATVVTFWDSLRKRRTIQLALAGINASVVGVLIAALYRPVWTSTIHSGLDFWLALAAFVALVAGRVQPWIVVLATGLVCGMLRG